MMKRIVAVAVLLLSVALSFSPVAAADDLLKRMNEILQKAPAEGEYAIKAADLAKMIAEKKTDFLVVDVRIAPPPAPASRAGRSRVRSGSPSTRSSRTRTSRSSPRTRR